MAPPTGSGPASPALASGAKPGAGPAASAAFYSAPIPARPPPMSPPPSRYKDREIIPAKLPQTSPPSPSASSTGSVRAQAAYSERGAKKNALSYSQTSDSSSKKYVGSVQSLGSMDSAPTKSFSPLGNANELLTWENSCAKSDISSPNPANSNFPESKAPNLVSVKDPVSALPAGDDSMEAADTVDGTSASFTVNISPNENHNHTIKSMGTPLGQYDNEVTNLFARDNNNHDPAAVEALAFSSNIASKENVGTPSSTTATSLLGSSSVVTSGANNNAALASQAQKAQYKKMSSERNSSGGSARSSHPLTIATSTVVPLREISIGLPSPFVPPLPHIVRAAAAAAAADSTGASVTTGTKSASAGSSASQKAILRVQGKSSKFDAKSATVSKSMDTFVNSKSSRTQFPPSSTASTDTIAKNVAGNIRHTPLPSTSAGNSGSDQQKLTVAKAKMSSVKAKAHQSLPSRRFSLPENLNEVRPVAKLQPKISPGTSASSSSKPAHEKISTKLSPIKRMGLSKEQLDAKPPKDADDSQRRKLDFSRSLQAEKSHDSLNILAPNDSENASHYNDTLTLATPAESKDPSSPKSLLSPSSLDSVDAAPTTKGSVGKLNQTLSPPKAKKSKEPNNHQSSPSSTIRNKAKSPISTPTSSAFTSPSPCTSQTSFVSSTASPARSQKKMASPKFTRQTKSGPGVAKAASVSPEKGKNSSLSTLLTLNDSMRNKQPAPQQAKPLVRSFADVAAGIIAKNRREEKLSSSGKSILKGKLSNADTIGSNCNIDTSRGKNADIKSSPSKIKLDDARFPMSDNIGDASNYSRPDSAESNNVFLSSTSAHSIDFLGDQTSPSLSPGWLSESFCAESLPPGSITYPPSKQQEYIFNYVTSAHQEQTQFATKLSSGLHFLYYATYSITSKVAINRDFFYECVIRCLRVYGVLLTRFLPRDSGVICHVLNSREEAASHIEVISSDVDFFQGARLVFNEIVNSTPEACLSTRIFLHCVLNELRLHIVVSRALCDLVSCDIFVAEIAMLYRASKLLNAKVQKTFDFAPLLEMFPNLVPTKATDFLKYAYELRSSLVPTREESARAYFSSQIYDAKHEMLNANERSAAEKVIRELATEQKEIKRKIANHTKRVAEMEIELAQAENAHKRLSSRPSISSPLVGAGFPSNEANNNSESKDVSSMPIKQPSYIRIDNDIVEIPDELLPSLMHIILGENMTVESMLEQHSMDLTITAKFNCVGILEFAELNEEQLSKRYGLIGRDRRRVNALSQFCRNRIAEVVRDRVRIRYNLERQIIRLKRTIDMTRMTLQQLAAESDRLACVQQQKASTVNPQLNFRVVPYGSLEGEFERHWRREQNLEKLLKPDAGKENSDTDTRSSLDNSQMLNGSSKEFLSTMLTVPSHMQHEGLGASNNGLNNVGSSDNVAAPCDDEDLTTTMQVEISLEKVTELLKFAREHCLPRLLPHNTTQNGSRTDLRIVRNLAAEGFIDADEKEEIDDDLVNGVLFILFALLLRHVLGTSEFVIGVCFSLRQRFNHEGTPIGPLSHTVPLRIDFGDPTQVVRDVIIEQMRELFRARYRAIQTEDVSVYSALSDYTSSCVASSSTPSSSTPLTSNSGRKTVAVDIEMLRPKIVYEWIGISTTRLLASRGESTDVLLSGPPRGWWRAVASIDDPERKASSELASQGEEQVAKIGCGMICGAVPELLFRAFRTFKNVDFVHTKTKKAQLENFNSSDPNGESHVSLEKERAIENCFAENGGSISGQWRVRRDILSPRDSTYDKRARELSESNLQRWLQKLDMLIDGLCASRRNTTTAQLISRFYHSAWSTSRMDLVAPSSKSSNAISETGYLSANLRVGDSRSSCCPIGSHSLGEFRLSVAGLLDQNRKEREKKDFNAELN